MVHANRHKVKTVSIKQVRSSCTYPRMCKASSIPLEKFVSPPGLATDYRRQAEIPTSGKVPH